jgi:hypothetical protein
MDLIFLSRALAIAARISPIERCQRGLRMQAQTILSWQVSLQRGGYAA